LLAGSIIIIWLENPAYCCLTVTRHGIDGPNASISVLMDESLADKTAKKPRGKPFAPGNRANLHGRPKGSRCLALRALDAVGDENAMAVLAAVVKKARQGDMRAAELVLSHCWPERKGRPISFDLPDIARPADLTLALSAVLKAASTGRLTCEEASALAVLFDGQRKLFEFVELEARVAVLEASDMQQRGGP
jgi:hypothetical protein